MRILSSILAGVASLVAVASADPAEPQAKPESILFSESFEDAHLAERDWCDGTKQDAAKTAAERKTKP